MKPYNREGSSKSEEIEEMFDRIAPNYDMLNHTLSFNIDKIWRWRMVRAVTKHNPKRMVDVATGTGDVAIALAKKAVEAEVVGVDLSEGMLAFAREKSERQGVAQRVQFVQGKAEALCDIEGVGEGGFDSATCAFGVRNFESVEGGIEQMVRALRIGGQLVILEFSTPSNAVVRFFYNFYSYKILPFIASLASRSERSAYEYLPASVDEFHTPAEMLDIMRKAGLVKCKKMGQTFGVAHIYIGIKGE